MKKQHSVQLVPFFRGHLKLTGGCVSSEKAIGLQLHKDVKLSSTYAETSFQKSFISHLLNPNRAKNRNKKLFTVFIATFRNRWTGEYSHLFAIVNMQTSLASTAKVQAHIFCKLSACIFFPLPKTHTFHEFHTCTF